MIPRFRSARGLLALAGALGLAACGEPEHEWPDPSPALWEVSDASGPRGWLFGTIHAQPESIEWRTDMVDRAFAQADTLVVEVDLRTVDRDVFWDLSKTPGLGPPSHRVDPAQREIVAVLLERSGYPDRELTDVESWAAALLLASGYRYGDGENGVDRALIGEADGKRLVELEGYAGQLAIFDKLPGSEQADMLEIAANEVRTAMRTNFADAERRFEAWRTGDTATIEAEMTSGLLADPELREALLTGRNRAWTAKLDPLLRGGGDVFIAVGAAHMLGDEGLPELLAERGFTVRRVQ